MSFATLLINRLTRHPFADTDKWNKDNFGVDVGPINCRFDPQTGAVVRSLNGEDEVIDGMVYVEPAASIDPKDELTIDGIRYRIIMAKTQNDLTGPHHVKMAVKRKGP